MKHSILFRASAVVMISSVILAGCSNRKDTSDSSGKEIDSLRKEILTLTSGKDTIASHLKIFDTLDFTVFSNQQWTRLHESHASDIKVHWPDGHMTEGIERHITDLKALFVHAPNTQIKVHPIRFGSDNMTAVTGIMTGTFTKPLPVGNGKFIQPTGKSFSLPMCTIGIWKNGTMSEEYLYWDNQTYMNQLGVGK
jgi:hypothetical protein